MVLYTLHIWVRVIDIESVHYNITIYLRSQIHAFWSKLDVRVWLAFSTVKKCDLMYCSVCISSHSKHQSYALYSVLLKTCFNIGSIFPILRVSPLFVGFDKGWFIGQCNRFIGWSNKKFHSLDYMWYQIDVLVHIGFSEIWGGNPWDWIEWGSLCWVGIWTSNMAWWMWFDIFTRSWDIQGNVVW